MNLKSRLKKLEDAKQPPDKTTIYVIMEDLDDPNLVHVNHETMTWAEYKKRFPEPHTVIHVTYDKAAIHED